MAGEYNGIEYGWLNLQIAFLGNNSVKGVTSIKYKITKERENIYGRGQEPVAIGLGNKTYEGEITLLRSEIIAIRDAAGAGSLVDIPPFDIAVEYGNGNNALKTDILQGVTFLEDGTEASQGDKSLPLTIPLGILKVVFQ